MNQKICPLCKKRYVFKKSRKVKEGYRKRINGKYVFIQTGTRIIIDEYWSCEKCTKLYSTEDYNRALIKIFNKESFNKNDLMRISLKKKNMNTLGI